MSRIYDALHKAESSRSEVDRERGDAKEAEREFSGDLSDLGAALTRLERSLPEIRHEMVEELAGLEVSIGAIEDRLEEDLGPADPRARASARADGRALDQRLAHLEQELSGLRAEIGETVDKRVQPAVSQWAERERTTRDRFEVRLDALRRDLNRGQQRQAILLGAVLLCGFLVYAC